MPKYQLSVVDAREICEKLAGDRRLEGLVTKLRGAMQRSAKSAKPGPVNLELSPSEAAALTARRPGAVPSVLAALERLANAVVDPLSHAHVARAVPPSATAREQTRVVLCDGDLEAAERTSPVTLASSGQLLRDGRPTTVVVSPASSFASFDDDLEPSTAAAAAPTNVQAVVVRLDEDDDEDDHLLCAATPTHATLSATQPGGTSMAGGGAQALSRALSAPADVIALMMTAYASLPSSLRGAVAAFVRGPASEAPMCWSVRELHAARDWRAAAFATCGDAPIAHYVVGLALAILGDPTVLTDDFPIPNGVVREKTAKAATIRRVRARLLRRYAGYAALLRDDQPVQLPFLYHATGSDCWANLLTTKRVNSGGGGNAWCATCPLLAGWGGTAYGDRGVAFSEQAIGQGVGQHFLLKGSRWLAISGGLELDAARGCALIIYPDSQLFRGEAGAARDAPLDAPLGTVPVAVSSEARIERYLLGAARALGPSPGIALFERSLRVQLPETGPVLTRAQVIAQGAPGEVFVASARTSPTDTRTEGSVEYYVLDASRQLWRLNERMKSELAPDGPSYRATGLQVTGAIADPARLAELIALGLVAPVQRASADDDL